MLIRRVRSYKITVRPLVEAVQNIIGRVCRSGPQRSLARLTSHPRTEVYRPTASLL